MVEAYKGMSFKVVDLHGYLFEWLTYTGMSLKCLRLTRV